MSATTPKVIIIAAGLSSRMRPLTEELPKCMLDFAGKTLLRRQLDAFRDCGIEDVSVIRGYRGDKIDLDGLRYFENPDFDNNNILNSLFYAEEAIEGDVIISYSDILFESRVVKSLLGSDEDISIVVDTDWRGYYVGRDDHPIEEAENVVFDDNRQVVEIGKILTGGNDVDGEFIGMMKLTPAGAGVYKRHFHQAKQEYWGRPFQRTATFEKAYLTDLFQEMTDLGTAVHCVTIERGWKEIDTVEDYEKAVKALKTLEE
ncbi:MAG: phosphocholine cytidylyltransferase family protein [Proteobacteria bacterium]|nr:phosphocholine cytidylyltransferase family protein [Pseudomonadota bacterium]